MLNHNQCFYICVSQRLAPVALLVWGLLLLFWSSERYNFSFGKTWGVVHTNCGVGGENRRRLSPAQGMPADSRGWVLSLRFPQRDGPAVSPWRPVCFPAQQWCWALRGCTLFLPTCAPCCILIFTWLIMGFFWCVPAWRCFMYLMSKLGESQHRSPRSRMQLGLFFGVDDFL